MVQQDKHCGGHVFCPGGGESRLDCKVRTDFLKESYLQGLHFGGGAGWMKRKGKGLFWQ